MSQKPKWTDEEVEIVKHGVLKNASDEEIGKVIGRSASAVHGKKNEMGICKTKKKEIEKEESINFVEPINITDLWMLAHKININLEKLVKAWGA